MIRLYQDDDKAELVEIFNLNVPTYFGPKELEDYREYLTHYADTYFVITHLGKIAGGIGYYIDRSKKSGHITWILVHPNHKGMGLGRQGLEHCLTILIKSQEVEKLVVSTSQFAYEFFKHFGYELVETKKDYWAPGLDLYLMERIL
jgi:ribosomal protein S18 acetylase RimI-like enzyme